MQSRTKHNTRERVEGLHMYIVGETANFLAYVLRQRVQAPPNIKEAKVK